MADAKELAAYVDEWLARAAKGAGRSQPTKLLEEGIRALWRRTDVTLGEVTLTAIADRVLTNSAERFPFLGAVTAQTCSEERVWNAVHERAAQTDREEVYRGVRYVLTEFLTVIDNLTGGILTPALRNELESLRRDAAADVAHTVDSPAEPRPRRRTKRRKRKQGIR